MKENKNQGVDGVQYSSVIVQEVDYVDINADLNKQRIQKGQNKDDDVETNRTSIPPETDYQSIMLKSKLKTMSLNARDEEEALLEAIDSNNYTIRFLRKEDYDLGYKNLVSIDHDLHEHEQP